MSQIYPRQRIEAMLAYTHHGRLASIDTDFQRGYREALIQLLEDEDLRWSGYKAPKRARKVQ